MMNFMTMENNRKVGKRFTLEELFRGLNINLSSKYAGIEITGIVDDSRDVKMGDLFVAVPGHSVDGRKYISEAVSMGASAVLTAAGSEIFVDIPIALSSALRDDMAAVAGRIFDHPSSKMTVSGITGTNGKTTSIYLLSDIFGHSGTPWGRIGTIGCQIGEKFLSSANTTPGIINTQKFLAEMVAEGLKGCAMEVSSHALHQGRSLGIEFASATFTNLSQDHLDYHRDLDDYFEAKAVLFDNVPLSVINIDDPYGQRLTNRASGRIITFGTTESADLRYACLDMDIKGSKLKFQYEGNTLEFVLPLPGIFNHQNAAAAGATAIGLGMSLEQVAEGLSNAGSVPGRLQSISGGLPFAVFVDYAHTPDALEKLLTSLREYKPNKLHVVFGCGGDRDRKKRPLMAKTASNLADFVYLTSDNPRTEDPKAIIDDALKGIGDRKKCQVIEDRTMAIKAAIGNLNNNDILVIAGKGHEEYQVIGTVRKYFSDIEIAKSELRKLGYGIDG